MDLTQISFCDLIALKEELAWQCSIASSFGNELAELKLRVAAVRKEILRRIDLIPT